MRTFDIGILIDPEKGLAYFGLDEVNRAIAAGARVVEVRPGGVVMPQVTVNTQNESTHPMHISHRLRSWRSVTREW